MPKVKVNGEWVQFEFDQDMVARLLYDGYEVHPDEGIDESQMQQEKLLVNDRLTKLWGSQKFQTEYGRWGLDAPPTLREDDSFGKRIMAPGTRNQGTVRTVKPNPTTLHSIRWAKLVKPTSYDL